MREASWLGCEMGYWKQQWDTPEVDSDDEPLVSKTGFQWRDLFCEVCGRHGVLNIDRKAVNVWLARE